MGPQVTQLSEAARSAKDLVQLKASLDSRRGPASYSQLQAGRGRSPGYSNELCLSIYLSIYIYVYINTCVLYIQYIFIDGSLVKLPTIWADEKQRWEESEKRREEERRSEKRKSQKKEDAGARKGRKVANHCVFQMIGGSGGSKSRLAKRRVRSHLSR